MSYFETARKMVLRVVKDTEDDLQKLARILIDTDDFSNEQDRDIAMRWIESAIDRLQNARDQIRLADGYADAICQTDEVE